MKRAPTRSEPGAPAASGEIPLSVPELGPEAWAYVKEALDANWVAVGGPYVERFERMVADHTGAAHAVATTSGTAALHVALLLAGVGPDDEVVVSDLTFVASANAVRYCGAWPVFIDAEPVNWQMDPVRLAEFLEDGCQWQDGALRNRTTGRRVRAIQPVHILGHPVDLAPVLDLAQARDVAVIEDATESLGARYQGRMVGSLGDAGCFSFNGNKLLTTGGGGVIVTDREEWAARARYLTTQAKDDPVEYVHAEVGYNYRLSSVQAALGCAQMERIDEHIEAKRRIAARYREGLAAVPGIELMPEAPLAQSVCWLSTVLVDEAVAGLSSRDLLARLASARVQARPLWQPMHLSPAHRGAQALGYPVAERLYAQALSLPSSVGLSAEDQDRVIEAVATAVARATKE